MGQSAAMAAPHCGRLRALQNGLILAPAGALDAHRPAIEALAQRGLLPNPFFLPAFLEPALAAFGKNRVKLALLYDGGELVFFAPVVENPVTGPLFRSLRVWTHAYAPLGTPLLPRKRAREIAVLLATSLQQSGTGTFVMPDAPLGVLEIAAIRKAVIRGGGGEVTARCHDRPILCAGKFDNSDDADRAIAAMVSRKRRKEMGRQLRRLGDLGPVAFATFGDKDDGRAEAAFSDFLALEAAGWKGRSGTAMGVDPMLRQFGTAVVRGLAAQGRVRIDTLHSGGRLAASLVSLRCRGLVVPWKIAFDEALGAYSPGSQLMLSATRSWLADPAVRRVDPVCGADHPMLRHLWRETDRYATLVLGPGGAGPTQRIFGAADRLIDRTRRGARQFRDTAGRSGIWRQPR